MNVPSEIRSLLGGREPSAYAALSCSLSQPIGETHLVVADGQLFVFTRESLLGEFSKVELDPAHPPKLEKGDFSDTLHLALADGTAHELNVSSFERDALNDVLSRDPAPAQANQVDKEIAPPDPLRVSTADDDEPPIAPSVPAADDNPFELPSQLAAEKKAEEAFKLPPVAPASMPSEEPDTGLIDRRSRAKTRQPDYEPNEERIDRDDKAERKDIYHSEHPGTLGCWLQFFLFLGGVLAIWSLHIAAYDSAAKFLDWEVDTDSASYVLTKIVAVIAGAWVGIKLAGIISWMARRGNWGGYLEFRGMDAVFHGPKGAWKKSIDLSKPFEAECLWKNSSSNSKPNDNKNFNVIVVFRQDGTEAGLGGILLAKQVNFNVKGMQYTELPEAPKFPFAFTLNQKNLRKVVARIMET